MLAKNIEASNVPATTPNARLWVATTTTTVTSITMLVESGYSLRLRIDPQLKVLTETIIITATKAAIGILANQSPRKIIIINSEIPALKVERRVRPPDLTLIID
ncbi:hypothetical protein APX70_05714 [Pseudomonas syringae pv. maculicola]|uniref:Uncharacterized protein n=1 Tax=Pseudomonas syringae pv. maculicola TaxID=59511 RepID=A0A3M2XIH5_PSEYM|nr:hypothetical protein APX70_05714 [Pseudomonas syringae pv. maculicola]